MQSESLLDCGVHGGPSTKCVKTEYALAFYSLNSLAHYLANILPQGYELAEEEVRISLDDFRERFADASGAPEYASLLTICSAP